MLSHLGRSLRSLTAGILLAVFAVPFNLLAQDHVVSTTELQKQVLAATQARHRNIKTLGQFLSTPTAEKAIKAAGMDAGKVQTAVASLSDQDLAQLAAKASRAQADFAAGNLSDRDLILIILGVAALILIIVAVR